MVKDKEYLQLIHLQETYVNHILCKFHACDTVIPYKVFIQ